MLINQFHRDTTSCGSLMIGIKMKTTKILNSASLKTIRCTLFTQNVLRKIIIFQQFSLEKELLELTTCFQLTGFSTRGYVYKNFQRLLQYHSMFLSRRGEKWTKVKREQLLRPVKPIQCSFRNLLTRLHFLKTL